MSFREIVRTEAERRGWSAYRLGKESGVPARAVQRYFSDTHDLPGERVALLAQALALELRSAPRPKRKG